jgi:3-oxoacyl-[acyl-carrier protein] reductase
MTLMKSIANEYAKNGITANALAPALIDTDMIANTRDLVSRIPVGRFGTTDEVAALVTFLCSAHAGYITGEVTDINGGFLID